MSQGSEDIDYNETPDVTEVHAAIQREAKDPSADVTPVPLWVTLLCGAAVCWAGAYIGMFHGGFNASVYNEFESSPAILFPQAKRVSATTGPAVAEDMVAIGKGVYLGVCQACHQASGMGQPGAIPPLASSEWVLGNEKRAAMILLKGLMGPVHVKGAVYNGVMPAQEAQLSDKKIAAVLTYIRQEWGNKAAAITPAQISAARKEFAAQKLSWAEADLLKIPDDAKLEGGEPAPGTPTAPATNIPPPGSAEPKVETNQTVSAEVGKVAYMTICVACHQPTGQGLPTIFPSLVKSEYVSGSPERLIAMVLKGIQPPFTYNGVTYTQMMIPQEAVLEDSKVASILTYVRTSFENSAPPIVAEDVAKARKKYLDRKTPWTEAELRSWAP